MLEQFGDMLLSVHAIFLPDAQKRRTAEDMLRRLYWDTASIWRPPVLRMRRLKASISQGLRATDYPYLRREPATTCRRDVETSPEPDSKESRAILSDKASDLFPRLAR